MELAARIGQSLLKKNKTLTERNELLEEQVEHIREEVRTPSLGAVGGGGNMCRCGHDLVLREPRFYMETHHAGQQHTQDHTASRQGASGPTPLTLHQCHCVSAENKATPEPAVFMIHVLTYGCQRRVDRLSQHLQREPTVRRKDATFLGVRNRLHGDH